MPSSSRYVRTLPPDVQRSIRDRLEASLPAGAVEDAMDSRLCDLEDL